MSGPLARTSSSHAPHLVERWPAIPGLCGTWGRLCCPFCRSPLSSGPCPPPLVLFSSSQARVCSRVQVPLGLRVVGKGLGEQAAQVAGGKSPRIWRPSRLHSGLRPDSLTLERERTERTQGAVVGLFSYGGGWGVGIHLASTQGKDPVTTEPQVGTQAGSWGEGAPGGQQGLSEDPSCSLLGLRRSPGPKWFIPKIQMGLRALLLTRAGGQA